MNKMQDRLGTPCHIENCRRKSRDDATAYIPSAPDITAAREKGYGATFSHGKNVEPSKRILKTIAANMIDCPEQKSRAGVYDTITIRDDDGNTYKQMLDFCKEHNLNVIDHFDFLQGHFEKFQGEYDIR